MLDSICGMRDSICDVLDSICDVLDSICDVLDSICDVRYARLDMRCARWLPLFLLASLVVDETGLALGGAAGCSAYRIALGEVATATGDDVGDAYELVGGDDQGVVEEVGEVHLAFGGPVPFGVVEGGG